jgi:hypothetical protein
LISVRCPINSLREFISSRYSTYIEEEKKKRRRKSLVQRELQLFVNEMHINREKKLKINAISTA